MAKLRADKAPANELQEALLDLGGLRRALELFEQKPEKKKAADAEHANNERAQLCLRLRRRIAELDAQPNTSAEVEMLQEQLEPEWAQLDRDGRAWVNKNARNRRQR